MGGLRSNSAPTEISDALEIRELAGNAATTEGASCLNLRFEQYLKLTNGLRFTHF